MAKDPIGSTGHGCCFRFVLGLVCLPLLLSRHIAILLNWGCFSKRSRKILASSEIVVTLN